MWGFCGFERCGGGGGDARVRGVVVAEVVERLEAEGGDQLQIACYGD